METKASNQVTLVDNGLTVTITDSKKLFSFTLKKEFLDQFPDADGMELQQLVSEKSISKFFHNPTGPAVRYHKSVFPTEVITKLSEHPALREDKETGDILAYWLNGQILQDEALKKFLHDISFNKDFENFISGN